MTRKAERIPAVLAAVKAYWEHYPDLRLGQLISNAANKVGIGVFNIEEIDLLKGLDAHRLFTSGSIWPADEIVVLFRNGFEHIEVPFNWFTPNSAQQPNFEVPVEIIDCGQTVKLGEYEVWSDTILRGLEDGFRVK